MGEVHSLALHRALVVCWFGVKHLVTAGERLAQLGTYSAPTASAYWTEEAAVLGPFMSLFPPAPIFYLSDKDGNAGGSVFTVKGFLT